MNNTSTKNKERLLELLEESDIGLALLEEMEEQERAEQEEKERLQKLRQRQAARKARIIREWKKERNTELDAFISTLRKGWNGKGELDTKTQALVDHLSQMRL